MARRSSRVAVTIDNSVTGRIESGYGAARLIGWQFAADGAWDSSERIFFEEPTPKLIERVCAWLGKQTSKDIAFEALFKLPGAECACFGVRITRLAPKAKETVLRNLVSACPKNESPESVIAKTRTILACPLILQTPDVLELGVFDVWNQVKPITVWERGDKATLLPQEAFKGKIKIPSAGYSKLDQPQTQPLILEAIWQKDDKPSNDYPCWISLPVGEIDIDGHYVLSEKRYREAAQILSNRQP